MKIEPVFVGFDFTQAELIDELRKNVETLLGTPGPVVENLLSLEIIEKIDTYEPRLTVKNITFTHDMNGHIKALVRLGANQYYEEPEEETDEELEEEVD